MEARAVATLLETRRGAAGGAADRLDGYGMTGLGFESGDIVAWYRVTASSIGPPFSTIWHRDPNGRWTCYSNVEPCRSCARYFAADLCDARRDDIEIRWTGPHELAISAARARLHLALRLESTPMFSVLGVAARLLPDGAWQNTRTVARIAALTGRLLRITPVALTGNLPAGFRFRVRPTRIWRVIAAAALLDCRDPGNVVPAAPAAARVPVQGLFTAGHITLEPAPAIEP